MGDRAQLRRRIAGETWTSHNIELDASFCTIPGAPGFFATDTRLAAVRRMMRARFGADLSKLRVADLGCLEGGFAVALALEGAAVVALEARPANLAKAELVREWFGLESLTLIEADVKDFHEDRFGSFDVVLALGILYHLDRPAAWLRQIAAATSTMLIVDTHIAPPTDERRRQLRADIRELSALEAELHVERAYVGRWYVEYPPDIPDAQRGEQLWASWSNHRSFWLTEQSLLEALRDAGFDLVLQQHDATLELYQRNRYEFSRGMFVAMKSPLSLADPL